MWLALLLAVAPLGRPCLPTELGRTAPPPPPAIAPPPPPPPPAAPAPPPLAGPLSREERAQYRLAFGVLGQLGQLTITLSPAGAPSAPLRASGQAHGSLLGFGETEKRLDTELDPRSLAATRWTAVRSSGGKSVTDFAQQPAPGTVAMLRRRTGKPDRPAALRRQGAILDPLTFLLRLRVAPPRSSQSFEVLDGQGLWTITMAPARPEGDGAGRSLRLDGKAAPLTWDGKPDGERSSHTFTLWLTADDFHTPLRLVMPLPVGEARAELVSLSRRRPAAPAPRPLTRAPQLRWLASP